MSDQIIPPAVKLAAKRGFIRTASQSIATALAGGITVALATDAVSKAQAGDWVTLGIAAAVAVGTPLINGAQSYFSIIAKGLPDDYLPAALDQAETH